MTLFLVRPFIHPSFHEILEKMSFGDRLSFLAVHIIDKHKHWYQLPVFLGLLYLHVRRNLLRTYNLFKVGETDTTSFNPDDYLYRTANGEYNDPSGLKIGSENTFFGRNMLPMEQKNEILIPDPVLVATKLLGRRTLQDTGKQFNLIAASWLQYQIHDWADHLENTNQITLTAPEEVANQCPLKSFKFYATKEIPTNDDKEIKAGHINIRTSWWDASANYGSNEKKSDQIRTFVDGKLKLGLDNLLQRDDEGRALSGDVRNSWAGVSILQALFVKEHNAVCDALKEEYPSLDDEQLFRHGKLVTSAVIAKIHVTDWSVELLKTDTMNAAMNGNWYGILGKRFKRIFGHTGSPALSGLVGMKEPNNHGTPYSLTEEFVSVYRMHPFLTDTVKLRDIHSNPGPNKSPEIQEEIKIEELVGIKGESRLSQIGFERKIVSMGHQSCGALALWNYPLFFRNLIPHNVDGSERDDHVDLASLEIYRDRERNVARYNQFRRNLLMIPITKWEDLTDDHESIEALREVYGDDVEKLDILVGLMAEKKIKGIAISETAFMIFVLMASRRLEADRFFTSNFNEKTYTKKGLDWVNNTEGLRDVIHRHYPEITKKWLNSTSAFSVWDAAPNATNLIPLYLRIP